MSARRVLVVEDDILVRMDCAEMLSKAGYQVLEAKDADEAIDLLSKQPDIAAIFTDIEMPGSMDGLRLARAVRDRWPPVKILATSAHAHFNQHDLPEGGRFLWKPYSHEQITQALEELLES
jgi:CheY-like chemotaxis protein